MRSLYPFLLMLTLGVLGVMWLRPGLAQELLTMAANMRAQSPDTAVPNSNVGTSSTPYQPSAAASRDPFANLPYDSVSRPPVQPMPVARPTSWPGQPLNNNAGVNNAKASLAAAYGPAAQNPSTQNPPVNNGVRVWDPSGASSGQPQVGIAPYSRQPSAVQPVAAAEPYAPATYPVAAVPAVAANQTQVIPQANGGPYGVPPTQAAESNGSLAPNTYPQTNFPEGYQPKAIPTPTQPIDASNQSALEMPNITVLPSPPEDFVDARIVARIGSEVILAGDLNALIGDMLFRQKANVPPEQKKEAYDYLGRIVLKQLINMKLVYNDAIHTIPAAGLTKIQANITDAFNKEQLPKLLKENGVATQSELEAKLAERGSSLERVRRTFFENIIYQEWAKQKIKDEEIPISEVLGTYQQRIAEYEFPAKVRWEELMVRFDQFPDQAAANAAIADMGNEVMRGTPWADVAKARSQGASAGEGGGHDWTNQNSLVAKNIDQALFQLPVGSMSQILESPRGYHIVRPVERKAAGRTPFVDAQGGIKKQLKDERRKKQEDQYLTDLRQRTPIWTIYDNQPGGLEGPKQPAADGGLGNPAALP